MNYRLEIFANYNGTFSVLKTYTGESASHKLATFKTKDAAFSFIKEYRSKTK